MKLSKLFSEVSKELANIEIKGISIDTSEVQEGSLFFCLKGVRHDGHDFALEAQSRGAACIVCQHRLYGITCPCIIVENTRSALSIACATFYGHPENSLKIVGITGTNGKTTTAYIVRNVLKCANYRVGMIGTNGIFVMDERLECKEMTTPDPPDLFRCLKEMVEKQVDVVVMEVSAHALELQKTEAITFTVGAFTNFSQDHLDYFESMDKYAAAKLRLFDVSRSVVTNMDDALGRRIAKRSGAKAFSYGLENPSDVFAINESYGEAGIRFVMNLCDDIVEVKSNLAGRFNIYNVMCASLICRILGVSSEDIVKGVRSTIRVDGRFNVINTAKYTIIIDFAHTEDGLKNAIGAIKEFTLGRIITVFGCGGDRDRSKRRLMGKIASDMSDYCILTSDNPRGEAPEQIIYDIEQGIEGKNYSVIVDRKMAIRRATEMAMENDVVFIAGKGAEKYQEISGVKYEYNDEQYVNQLIESGVIR